MKLFDKIFGGIEMTWKRVLILSAVCGVIPGILMIPDWLKNTSFQNPGITFEFWILMALFIILNCKKPWEAAVKTFVFFLISQPLIYLVQVPFFINHWKIFDYYPRWFIITLLTLPGAFIGWYVKKGNLLSVLLLSVLNAILCMELPGTVNSMLRYFPKMTVAAVFILAEIVIFTFCLIREKKLRILAFVIAGVLTVAGCFWLITTELGAESSMAFPADGEAPYTLESESDLFAVTFNGESVIVSYKPHDLRTPGEHTVIYRDASGEVHEARITYGDMNCRIE